MKRNIVFLLALILLVGCFGDINTNEENESNSSDVDIQTNYVEFNGEKYYTGYVPLTEEEYLSYDQISVSHRGPIPASIDLSEYLPNPGNQGSQGSCTAWATGYAYKSFQEGLDRNWDVANNKEHQFSPAFIYNQINNGRDAGSSVDAALRLLVSQGCAPLSVMPYNQRDYRTQPSSTQKQEAAKYKAAKWGTVAAGNITEFKNHLAAGDLIVVGIPIYSDFNISSRNPIYDVTSGSLQGYHAIAFCGYDDDKQAFKLINSWGTSWGNSGYGWMSYNLVQSLRIRGYVMTDIDDDSSEPDPKPEPTPDPTPDPKPEPEPEPQPEPTSNKALGKATIVSNQYNSSFGGSNVVDGDTESSRWVVRNNGTNTWIIVDLGSNQKLNQVKTKWSLTNYAKTYAIYGQVAGSNQWEFIKNVNSNGDWDVVDLDTDKEYQYLALNLTSSMTNYYVLYECEIY